MLNAQDKNARSIRQNARPYQIRRARISANAIYAASLPLFFLAISAWFPRVSFENFSVGLASIPLLALSAAYLHNYNVEIGVKSGLTSTLGQVEFYIFLFLVLLSFASVANAENPALILRVIVPSVTVVVVIAALFGLHNQGYKFLIIYVVKCFVLTGALSIAVFALIMPRIFDNSFFFGYYRYLGGFENATQAAIVLGCAALASTSLAFFAKRAAGKILYGVSSLLLITGLVLAGGKAVLLLILLMTPAQLFLYSIRRSKTDTLPVKIIVSIAALAVVSQFAFTLVEVLSPTTASKIEEILEEDSIFDYQSMQSRQELWAFSVDKGLEYPLVGYGAGAEVMGLSHAHNIFLDYFKGLGFPGLLMIAWFCFLVVQRSVRLLRYRGDAKFSAYNDLACGGAFVGVFYVLANQLSDSFGPNTVGAFSLIFYAFVFIGSNNVPSDSKPLLPLR